MHSIFTVGGSVRDVSWEDLQNVYFDLFVTEIVSVEPNYDSKVVRVDGRHVRQSLPFRELTLVNAMPDVSILSTSSDLVIDV